MPQSAHNQGWITCLKAASSAANSATSWPVSASARSQASFFPASTSLRVHVHWHQLSSNTLSKALPGSLCC